MLQLNININFKSIETTKINNVLYCYIFLDPLDVSCPLCGGCEATIHEYVTKKIKHSISTNNPCFIIYKARGYKCKYCNNTFTLSHGKCSSYTTVAVLEVLRNHTATFTNIA